MMHDEIKYNFDCHVVWCICLEQNMEETTSRSRPAYKLL